MRHAISSTLVLEDRAYSVLPPSLRTHVEIAWLSEGYHDAAKFLGGRADGVTIVTAFFDVDRKNWGYHESEVSTKYRRSVDYYLSCFKHMAALDNDMIIFVAPEMVEDVKHARAVHGRLERTVILTIADFFSRPEVAHVVDVVGAALTERFRDFVWRPTAPEFNKPKYVSLIALKPTFAATAVDLGLVRNRQLAWIDFGYVRSPDGVDAGREWRFDFGEKINFFNIFEIDDEPLYDVVRRAEAYFQAGHIVGPAQEWSRLRAMFDQALSALIACDLMDDEQTLMLMIYRQHPGRIRLRRHGIDPVYDWRFIFRRFQTGLNPVDHDLPPMPRSAEPAWYRDLKSFVRRRLRRMVRQMSH